MIQITHCKCGYTHILKDNRLYSFKTKAPLKLRTVADFFRFIVCIFDRRQNIGYNVSNIGRH